MHKTKEKARDPASKHSQAQQTKYVAGVARTPPGLGPCGLVLLFPRPHGPMDL